MQHIIDCPQPGCGVPAEIVDRWTWTSTDGPVEHVKTWCASGHWFTRLWTHHRPADTELAAGAGGGRNRRLTVRFANARGSDTASRSQEKADAPDDRPHVLPQPGRGDRGPRAGSPTWPPTTPPARPRTPWPCSTATRPRPTTARWSAGASCPPPATSCTTSAGTPAPARCATRPRRPRPARARYLIVPGIGSSRTYVLDTKPDPASPRWSGDRGRGAGQQGRLFAASHRPLRARRHLPVRPGRGQRQRRPGGVALLDHDSFDVIGAWEQDRGTSSSATTAGGTSTTTPSSPPNGAPRR